MIVCVTGSCGTGKTTVAKALAKKYNLQNVDVGMLIKKNKLYDSYDRSLQTYIVDEKKVKKFLENFIRFHKNVVLDSHLSHYLNKKYVDVCVVVKCDIKALKKRLINRGYSLNKIRENLDAEIFDVCFAEALEHGHRIVTIDTSKGFKYSLLENIFNKYYKDNRKNKKDD